MIEKLFHLKEHPTDVKTEIIAGITTFMTMAYILEVKEVSSIMFIPALFFMLKHLL